MKKITYKIAGILMVATLFMTLYAPMSAFADAPASPAEAEEEEEPKDYGDEDVDYWAQYAADKSKIPEYNDVAVPDGQADIFEQVYYEASASAPGGFERKVENYGDEPGGIFGDAVTFKNGAVEVDTLTGPTGLGPDIEGTSEEDPAWIDWMGYEDPNANSGVKNAIQKAVDRALYNLFASTAENTAESLSIHVAPGEYSGDINIDVNKEDAFKDIDFTNFTLYILGEGSYDSTPMENGEYNKESISADAEANVKINGNINIRGINTVMAGLYLSMDKLVNAKNANVTVYGTKENDHINVSGDGTGRLEVYGGDGNDYIHLEHGPDTWTLMSLLPQVTPGGASPTSAYVDAGDGDDYIDIGINIAGFTGNVDIRGGDGKDTLNYSGRLSTADSAAEKYHISTQRELEEEYGEATAGQIGKKVRFYAQEEPEE